MDETRSPLCLSLFSVHQSDKLRGPGSRVRLVVYGEDTSCTHVRVSRSPTASCVFVRGYYETGGWEPFEWTSTEGSKVDSR